MILQSHLAGQWPGCEKSPGHQLQFVFLQYPQSSATQQDSRILPKTTRWEQTLSALTEDVHSTSRAPPKQKFVCSEQDSELQRRAC